MDIFEVKEYDIKDKKRNLNIKSSGVVSSTKYFPVFEENGKERIFKPLSKTKPYSTPLFAYSEVYWSYLIKKYIDSNTPQYYLAVCNGLSEEQNKYYNKGTIVDNILEEDEELINLLDLYKRYPDSLVNINEYVNYCEVQYNYSDILRSTFFTERKDLGEQLAEQILCSLLRRDDNYHYENVSLIKKNNSFPRVAPMIDMEFSQMFMHPDDKDYHIGKITSFDYGLYPVFKYNNDLSFEENYEIFLNKSKNGSIYDSYGYTRKKNIRENIKCITELYPNLVRNFIEKLKLMRKEVINIDIPFNDNYLGEFSSNDWEPTRMLLKDGYNEDDDYYKKAKEKAEKSQIKLNHKEFNDQLKKEVLWSIDKLIYILKLYLDINDNKIIDIRNYKEETLYPSERQSEEELELISRLLDEVHKTKTKVDK